MEFNECNFEYYTPKYILDMFGTFDYDPTTTTEQAKTLGIPNYSTIETDGLKQDWTKFKKIWINPPTYLIWPFLEKAVYTYQRVHNDIYFLAPDSILTKKKFHTIKENIGVKLYIPNGRIKFRMIYEDEEETPSFNSIIFKLQSEDAVRFFDIITPGSHYILNETDS